MLRLVLEQRGPLPKANGANKRAPGSALALRDGSGDGCARVPYEIAHVTCQVHMSSPASPCEEPLHSKTCQVRALVRNPCTEAGTAHLAPRHDHSSDPQAQNKPKAFEPQRGRMHPLWLGNVLMLHGPCQVEVANRPIPRSCLAKELSKGQMRNKGAATTQALQNESQAPNPSFGLPAASENRCTQISLFGHSDIFKG